MYFVRCEVEIILPYSLHTKMDGEIKTAKNTKSDSMDGMQKVKV